MHTVRLRPGSLCAALPVLLVGVLTCGCGGALNRVELASAVADAQLAARVRTALVNDPDVGTYPIDVRVTAGVVRLSGRVDSDTLRQRAISLARAVPNVTSVESTLVVGPGAPLAAPLEAPTGPAVDLESPSDAVDGDRRMLAIGAAVGVAEPTRSGLNSTLRVGPLFRLGSGTGLGLTIGFGWFAAGVDAAGGAELGTLRVKPIMGGLGYTVRRAQTSIGLSVVGGLALNGVQPHANPAVTGFLLDADNSLAWRPGVSLWFDMNPRIAFHVFTGYLITRPRLTFVEDGLVTVRRLRADTALLKVGLAYKLF